jgi:hypothetical protein
MQNFLTTWKRRSMQNAHILIEDESSTIEDQDGVHIKSIETLPPHHFNTHQLVYLWLCRFDESDRSDLSHFWPRMMQPVYNIFDNCGYNRCEVVRHSSSFWGSQLHLFWQVIYTDTVLFFRYWGFPLSSTRVECLPFLWVVTWSHATCTIHVSDHFVDYIPPRWYNQRLLWPCFCKENGMLLWHYKPVLIRHFNHLYSVTRCILAWRCHHSCSSSWTFRRFDENVSHCTGKCHSYRCMTDRLDLSPFQVQSRICRAPLWNKRSAGNPALRSAPPVHPSRFAGMCSFTGSYR